MHSFAAGGRQPDFLRRTHCSNQFSLAQSMNKALGNTREHYRFAVLDAWTATLALISKRRGMSIPPSFAGRRIAIRDAQDIGSSQLEEIAMPKAKKPRRKKTSKSVKANVKRRAIAKRATPKTKSKVRRASKRASKPAAGKRPKPVERKEMLTEAPVETTIVAVEQPAPGVLVVEEVVVREESTSTVPS